MPYHVIIAGSRAFTNYDLLRERCDTLLANRPDAVVISGGARGADQLGERYARERGLGVVVMPADWDAHGKWAGYLRNVAMADKAQALIAFWDGKSRGTEHMIRIGRERGLAVRVVRTDKA
ncbi:MAG TPA: DUF2493 domain-containing protein [Flavobacteriales bacterium]|nr:DUF2493 domain-containing protein [Flavobacteriales bacterium]